MVQIPFTSQAPLPIDPQTSYGVFTLPDTKTDTETDKKWVV